MATAAVVEGIETALTTLQPIRDLAKNWDIDIAGCLDEYLEDLELSQETRQHILAAAVSNSSSSLPNNLFAQAALVLQNSSGIYSRKVDYLYTHVYKVQEELVHSFQDNGKNNKRTSKTKVIEADLEDFYQFDPHQQFLLLDDVLPTDATDEGHKINLSTPNGINQSLSVSRLSMGGRLSLGKTTTSNQNRLSLGSVGTTTADFDQSTSTTLPQQRAVLLATIASLQSSQQETLRLTGNACDIGEEGVLFLPGSLPQNHGNNLFSTNTTKTTMEDQFGSGSETFQTEVDHDDDNDDGGVAFAMVDTDQDDTTITQELTLRQAKHVSFATSTVRPEDRDVMADPWAVLDRDTPDLKQPRPLRVGKTIIVPSTITSLPSECVTGSRTRRMICRPIIKNDHDAMRESRIEKNDLTSGVPLTGLAFGDEFAYIAKATAKRKADERREMLLKQQQTNQNLMPKEQNDAGYFGFYSGDYNDDDYNDEHHQDSGVDSDVTNQNGPIHSSNTGIASIEEAFRQNHYDDVANDDNILSSSHQTFEELCRAHIQNFARGAEKFASETKLTQRVQSWQARLQPLLEQEEERPVFDIFAYSNAVIASALEKGHDDTKSNQTIVDFEEVTANCMAPYEVCRLFLATLSLQNSGNFRFIDESSLRMELLNADIERPMETYLAPSAENQT